MFFGVPFPAEIGLIALPPVIDYDDYLIVEDGTAVNAANTYCTLDELSAYAKLRGKEGLVIADENKSEQALVLATDYLETKSYIGRPTWLDQALSWPRDRVYIDQTLFANNGIPLRLKQAQMECALVILAGFELDSVLYGRQVIKETVDVISVEYSERNNFIIPYMPKVNSLLRPLVTSAGSLSAIRI